MSKLEGLEYLRGCGLETVVYSSHPNELPIFENYSIRSSFPTSVSHPNEFHKFNLSLPGRFYVARENLDKEILSVEKEFTGKFQEQSEIIIHETHEILFSGNIYVNRVSESMIVEAWVTYDKNQIPYFSHSINRKTKVITIDSHNIYIPEGIQNIEFDEYNLEWIVTKDNELLFTELTVIG
jgi:hypothetical protein